jgi:hypothetical protein
MSLIKRLTASLTAAIDPDKPNPYKLADADDQDGWSREVHGLMADQGTPDDTVKTVPYEG